MDIGYYDLIRERVIHARQDRAEYITTLPAEFRQLAIRSTKSNTETILPGGVLGECYAFWIGDLFDIEFSLQREAALACIVGGAYFILQDRRIDSTKKVEAEVDLLGNLFLTDCIRFFYRSSRFNEKLWDYSRRALEEFAIAGHWEQLQHGGYKRFENHDLLMAAGRSAPVLICVAAMALAGNVEKEIPGVSNAIRKMNIGLQIRDDLADWRDDLLRGVYTYPITLAMERAIGQSRPVPKYMTIQEIESTLLLSDLPENLLEESSQYLVSALQDVRHLHSESFGHYIGYMIDQNENMKKSIISAKIEALADLGLLDGSS